MNDVNIKDIVIDGVQYYSAYFSCPVCAERGNMSPPAFWVHSSCPNDHLYIGSDATLYCSGCGRKVKIMNAHYACPNHSLAEGESLVYFEGDNINAVADRIAVAAAISYALPLIHKAGKEWFKALIMSL